MDDVVSTAQEDFTFQNSSWNQYYCSPLWRPINFFFFLKVLIPTGVASGEVVWVLRCGQNVFPHPLLYDGQHFFLNVGAAASSAVPGVSLLVRLF